MAMDQLIGPRDGGPRMATGWRWPRDDDGPRDEHVFKVARKAYLNAVRTQVKHL